MPDTFTSQTINCPQLTHVKLSYLSTFSVNRNVITRYKSIRYTRCLRYLLFTFAHTDGSEFHTTGVLLEDS